MSSHPPLILWPFLPWVIPFKRPIPAGTKPGADVGSVAWTQETAYTPSE